MTTAQQTAIEAMKRELRAMRRTADGLSDFEAADDLHRSINFILGQIEVAELDEQPECDEGELLAA